MRSPKGAKIIAGSVIKKQSTTLKPKATNEDDILYIIATNIIAPSAPKINPSQVFFALTLLKRGCLPKKRPPK